MDKIEIFVKSEYIGKTIKEFLKLNNVGRGKIESIRVNKESFINNEYKPLEYVLQKDDCLSFIINESIDFEIDNSKELDVVYDDDYILVVNKPYDMIIHPDDKKKVGTLVNLVASYYSKNNINRKIRFIHRIDRETTGALLFAKDFLTEAILLKMMQSNEIERSYIGFIEGKLYKKHDLVSINIGKDRHQNNKMIPLKDGIKAITEINVIDEYTNYSKVLFTLVTGRTHQIRVTMSYLKHPLLGDVLYGGNLVYIDRVALHSFRLSFIHPIQNKKMTIECQLPLDMKSLEN